jgi:hypothetical protein
MKRDRFEDLGINKILKKQDGKVWIAFKLDQDRKVAGVVNMIVEIQAP